MADVEAPWLTQVSLKTGLGTLINVRGMTAGEVEQGLDDIIRISDKIADAESAVGAVQDVKRGFGGNTQRRGSYDNRRDEPEAPPERGSREPDAPLCDCGRPAKFVPGGRSRTGNVYRAFWACDRPQREQCRFRQDA